MNALRRLLQEITEASGPVSLDQIARRIGVGTDEAEAMVGYWVRRGRLRVEDLAPGCPATGCGGCGQAPGERGGCAVPRRSRSGAAPQVITLLTPRAKPDTG